MATSLLSGVTHHPRGSKVHSLSFVMIFSSVVYRGLPGRSRDFSHRIMASKLFEVAACRAALSARAFPLDIKSFSFWCPLQWTTATLVGRSTASSRFRISVLYLIGDPPNLRAPSLSTGLYAHVKQEKCIWNQYKY